MRIAVVAAGDPTDPGLWSGTPRGLFDGVAALGHDAIPISALPSGKRSNADLAYIAARRWLRGGPRLTGRRAIHAARFGDEWGKALARTASARLKGLSVDGVIQASDGWIVPDAPVAMFIDMTTHQDIQVREFGARDLATPSLDARRERGAGLAYRAASAVCAATPWAAESVAADYGIDGDKIFAVGIGGARGEIEAPSRDWSIPRFLFVASNWERKNGPAVVEAFHHVRDQYPEAELHLVGDQPEIKCGGVLSYGFLKKDDPSAQRELAALYDVATCLVVPGRFEAAGIVYLEAAGAGIPSICGTVGGAQDIVGAGGTAVEPGQVGELAEAMVDLCDPDVASRLGRRAHRRSGQFTWAKVAQRMLAALSGEDMDGPDWSKEAGDA